MQLNDLINGTFEALGSICTWANVLKYRQDREIKGIYWPVTLFFATWGFWNLYYYPSLNQWFSFWAGAILVGGNATWLIMVMYDLWRKRNVK